MQIPFLTSPSTGLAMPDAGPDPAMAVDMTESQALPDSAAFSLLVQPQAETQDETRLPDALPTAMPVPVGIADLVTPTGSGAPAIALALDPQAAAQGLSPPAAAQPPTSAPAAGGKHAGIMGENTDAALPDHLANPAGSVAESILTQAPAGQSWPLSTRPEPAFLTPGLRIATPSDDPVALPTGMPPMSEVPTQGGTVQVAPSGVPALAVAADSLPTALRHAGDKTATAGPAGPDNLTGASSTTPPLRETGAKPDTALADTKTTAGATPVPGAIRADAKPAPTPAALSGEVAPMEATLPPSVPILHPAALALRFPAYPAAGQEAPDLSQDRAARPAPLPSRPDMPKPPLALGPAMPLFWGPLGETDAETGGFGHDLGPQVFGIATAGTAVSHLVPHEFARLGGPVLAQAATQIIASLAQGPEGSASLTLAPEELGRVRLEFHADRQNPDQLIVTLGFDRPETLELFRRHADQLADALRSAGYSGVQIGFGGSADDGSAPRQDPHPEADGPAEGPAAPIWQDQSPALSRTSATSALDLRL